MASNKRLNAIITIGGAISSGLKSALSSTQTGIKGIGDTVRDLDRRQRLLGKSIDVFRRAGKDVSGLQAKYAALIRETDRLRAAQDRLNKARERHESMKATAGKMATAGVVIGGTGAALGGVLSTGIRSAIQRENSVTVIRNSGVSKQDGDAMINAAQSSRQFGVSVTKATDTVSELRTALGDAHHAVSALPTALKAISGLQLYDRLHHSDMASGDSAYQMAKVSEERGGATDEHAMEEKYNWAFKALTGSNGKVTIGDLLTSVRSGKGAVQSMSDEAFFGDTFLQQSMGADRYGTSSSTLVNAWIGGHQTHGAFDHMLQMGLLNKNGVKFDKTGKVKTVSPDALVDAQMFLKDPQKWVDQHLVPLAKQKGVDVNDPAQIMKFVNAIASNPNAANMLLSRIRFSANIWKDRRNVLQANDINASDRANQDSTAGKVENARARLDDAQTRVGTILIPAFATAMERTATVLESLNKFAEENPRTMKAVVMGIGGLTIGMIALAPVLVTVGSLLTVISGIKLARAVASMRDLESAANGVTPAAAGAGRSILGFLGKLGMAAGLVTIGLELAKAAGLPDVDKKQGDQDVKNGNWWAASAHLSAGDFLSAGWRHMTGNQPPEVPPLAGTPARSAPQMAGTAGAAGGSGAVVTDNSKTEIHIHQQPGESHEALVDRMMKKLRDREGVAQRGRLYDPAMGG